MSEQITQEQLDAVYEERNRLVAFLSHVFAETAWLSEGDDAEWPIVYMTLPLSSQVSWHIPRSQLYLFQHLSWRSNTWDGHTTRDKYGRLEFLGKCMKATVNVTYSYTLD